MRASAKLAPLTRFLGKGKSPIALLPRPGEDHCHEPDFLRACQKRKSSVRWEPDNCMIE